MNKISETLRTYSWFFTKITELIQSDINKESVCSFIDDIFEITDLYDVAVARPIDDVLAVYYSHGTIGSKRLRRRVNKSRGLVEKAFENNSPILLNKPEEIYKETALPKVAKKHTVSAVLTVPLPRYQGVIQFVKSYQNDSTEFDNNMVEFLYNVCEMVDILIFITEKIGDNERYLKHSKEITTLLSKLHHELKNTLQVTSMSFEIIKKQSSCENNKVIKALETNIKAFYTLINQLKQINQYHSCKLFPSIEMKKTNISQILFQIMDVWIEKAKDKDIDIITDIPKIVELEINEYLISIVMNNLLSNAVKYAIPKKSITFGLKDRKEYIECILTNYTNHEFSKDELMEMYEIDSPVIVDSKRRGAGIGLSIVSTAIEEHHGIIWSEYDKKSKQISFLVRLPKKHT